VTGKELLERKRRRRRDEKIYEMSGEKTVDKQRFSIND
jgi:hypothetical protein